MFKTPQQSSPVTNVIQGQNAIHRLNPGPRYHQIRYIITALKTAATAGFVSASLGNVIGVVQTKVNTKGTDIIGGAQLAAGAQSVFNGAAGARKDITVQNLDANGNSLTVYGDNGVALVVLAAGSPPWIKETAGSITVKNTSAGIITRAIVGETFYTA